MSKKKTIFTAALLLGAAFLTAAGGEAASGLHFDWIGFLGKTLNAVILFGGIFLLLRKPLIQYFSEHGFSIRRDIEEREEKIRHNSQELEAIDQRLQRIEEELDAMKKAAENSGQQEMARLQQLGLEETAKILSRTEGEINLRIESAVKKLRGKIAEMTIAYFSKDIQKKLDDQAHRKFIDRGIEGVKQLDERK